MFILMMCICAEVLKAHKLSHRSVHIQPRGLMNRANWCYVNAVSFMHTAVVIILYVVVKRTAFVAKA